jgi:hypothetical protein
MIDRTFVIPLLAGIAIAAPVGAGAQSSSEPALQDRWPAPTQQLEQRAAPPAATPPAAAPAVETSTPQAQVPAAPPAPSPEPSSQAPAPRSAAPVPTAKSGPRPERKPAGEAKKPARQPASHPAAPRQGTAVACGGVFSHNSSHQALETAFDAKNVAFMEVEGRPEEGGQEGRKLVASVVFPDDPKRRLEVLWENEGARTDVYRIIITGQSAWTGPKGLHLGLSLAAIEKINGKPFKLRGFDESNSAAAIDWQEGALDSLPGGCSVGVFFAADPTVPQSVRAEAAGAEFLSSDPVIRAVKPIVTEILFGYLQ